MKKKLLALVLVLAMCLPFISAMSIGAAATDSITTYVTLSNTGTIVIGSDTDHTLVAQAAVTVTDQNNNGGYDIDDVLYCLHEQFYSGGASAGYATSTGTYGLGITKLWGDTSGACGYWQNNTSAWSLTDTVQNGDYITAFIYADQTGWSDAYAAFTSETASGTIGTALSLTLQTYNWSSSGFENYPDADISVIGSSLTGTTDSNGQVSLTFPSAGTYYVTATKFDNSIVPAVCKVTINPVVTENISPSRKSNISATADVSTYVNKAYTLSLADVFEDANNDSLTYTVSINGATAVTAPASYSYTPAAIGTTTLVFSANDGTVDSTDTYTVTLSATNAPAAATALSALAAYFSTSANVLPFSSSDPNTQWAIADIMAYDSSLLSTDIKQAYVDYVIYQAPSTTDVGALARYIITLKALGYDATKIDTNGNGTYFDAVDKMNSQISSATSIYTLPYVLIALQQYGDTYSTQIDSIIGYILDDQISAGGWNGYGSEIDADTTGPVLLALGKYYTATDYTAAGITEDYYNNIQTAVNKTLGLVSGLQGAGGGISSWGSENAASTGLIMAGLSAIGQSPDSSSYLSKSLACGIMLLYDTTSRFSSGFYDEQGFRGLIAAANFSPSGYRMYDFSSNTTHPTIASAYYSNCFVTISVIPTNAAVVVADSSGTKTALTGTSYDLAAGDYSYTVACSGYTSKTGSFTVTSTEAAHSRKTISVSLSSAPSTSSNITVTVNVKVPDDSDTNNSYTYKDNAANYTNIVSKTVTLKSGSTVFDALDTALAAAGISYTEGSSGYISAINGLKELDHGSNSGWLYMVNGKTMQVGCRSYELTANSAVIWFFTDDYTKEYGSESWSSGSGKSAVATVVAGNSESAVINPAVGGTVGLGSEAVVTIPAGALSGTDKVEVAAQKLSSPPPAPTGFRLLGSVFEFSVGNSTAYTFHQPVKLSFSFDPKDLSSGQKPSIYYYDEKAMQWVDLGGTVSGNTISVNINHFSKYALFTKEITATLGKTFMDVPADFWASNAINDLYGRGFINGYADGSFKPDQSITRAEFSTILAKALGLNTHETTDKFTDVTADDWYYGAVNAAASANLVSGMDNKLFAPNTLITREQMAVMSAKALGDKAPVIDGNELNAFNDKSSLSSWAVSGMSEAIKAGIVCGMTADTLVPQANATRAQAAEMIYKLLTVLEK